MSLQSPRANLTRTVLASPVTAQMKSAAAGRTWRLPKVAGAGALPWASLDSTTTARAGSFRRRSRGTKPVSGSVILP